MSDPSVNVPYQLAGRAAVACQIGYQVVSASPCGAGGSHLALAEPLAIWDAVVVTCAGYYALIKGRHLARRASEFGEGQSWLNCKYEVAEQVAAAGAHVSADFFEDRRQEAIEMVDKLWPVIERTASLLSDLDTMSGDQLAEAFAAAESEAPGVLPWRKPGAEGEGEQRAPLDAADTASIRLAAS